MEDSNRIIKPLIKGLHDEKIDYKVLSSLVLIKVGEEPFD